MLYNIDFKKLVSLEDYAKSLAGESDSFLKLSIEAQDYMRGFDWCLDIQESYVGMYYEGIFGVFMFHITPINSSVDEWLWVICGDLPPIYITVEDSPNAACALDSYIGAMEEWVLAVKNKQSTQNVVPVNVPETIENAKALEVRLNFLDDKILCHYEKELKE